MSVNYDKPYWFSDEAWEAVKPWQENIHWEDYGFAFGPGHIVFSDPNLNDHSIDFCLAECDDAEGMHADRMDPEDADKVRSALLALKAIPEERRYSEKALKCFEERENSAWVPSEADV